MSDTTSRHLHFRNLPPQTTEQAVRAACVPYGDLTDVYVPLDRVTQRCRGFAFVTFETEEDAHHAMLNLHCALFYNNVIRVEKTSAVRRSSVSSAFWFSTTFQKLFTSSFCDDSAATLNCERTEKTKAYCSVTRKTHWNGHLLLRLLPATIDATGHGEICKWPWKASTFWNDRGVWGKLRKTVVQYLLLQRCSSEHAVRLLPLRDRESPINVLFSLHSPFFSPSFPRSPAPT